MSVDERVYWIKKNDGMSKTHNKYRSYCRLVCLFIKTRFLNINRLKYSSFQVDIEFTKTGWIPRKLLRLHAKQKINKYKPYDIGVLFFFFVTV